MEFPFAKRQKRCHSSPSLSNLETLPRDIVSRIANDYLSPNDRLKLSSCSHQLRSALPLPLVIEIANEDRTKAIKQRFFVSPRQKQKNYEDVPQTANQKNCYYCQGDMLYSHEPMHYGQEYIFWNFDYSSHSPVFLGRHTRHGYNGVVSPEQLVPTNSVDELPCESFYIGLRLGNPTQTWQVVGDSLVCSTWSPVDWGDVVGLMVGGRNPRRGQPDSLRKGFLSCFPNDAVNHYPNWMVLIMQNKRTTDDSYNKCVEWGACEKLRLISNPKCGSRETVLSSTVGPTRAQSLVVAEIPDVCEDGQHFIYYTSGRPYRLRQTHSVGKHVVVWFHFWIDCGIMHFMATNLLFSLAIPILKDDGGNYSGLDKTACGVLALRSLCDDSNRWRIITRYMTEAAVELSTDGPYLPDMEGLMRKFRKFHSSYSVEYRESSKSIHVDVQGGVINDLKDDGTPFSCRFRKRPVWKFVLTL